MNKYAALGLIMHAGTQGKHITVLTHSQGAARAELDQFLRVAEDAGIPLSQVHRGNGRERLRFTTGGEILFRSARAEQRGYSTDVIYLDETAHTQLRDPYDLQAMTATGGEIIRA